MTVPRPLKLVIVFSKLPFSTWLTVDCGDCCVVLITHLVDDICVVSTVSEPPQSHSWTPCEVSSYFQRCFAGLALREVIDTVNLGLR